MRQPPTRGQSKVGTDRCGKTAIRHPFEQVLDITTG
jgi:hypothetical protein